MKLLHEIAAVEPSVRVYEKFSPVVWARVSPPAVGKHNKDAWDDFFLGDPDEEFIPDSLMTMVFFPWFFFNWTYKVELVGIGGTVRSTVAESFIRQTKLAADEKAYLRDANRRPYSLCEVVAVKPGAGITLFDLLREVEFEVVERSGSRYMHRGQILYCSIAQQGGMTSIIGNGPYPMSPLVKRKVKEFRQWLVDEAGVPIITAEELREVDDDVREFYLEIVDAMLQPPVIVNTDNEPLVPQTVHYEVDSADRAFQALKNLAAGMSDDELLRDATVTEGVVEQATFPWCGGNERARKSHGGPIVLGTIKLEGPKLAVMVNSAERAERVRELIEDRLGGAARFKATLVEPVESELNQRWENAVREGSGRSGAPYGKLTGGDGGVIDPGDLPPEAREALEAHAREFWANWFDSPVPALDGMTPRAAAKTEDGRELLESLMLFYESNIEADNPGLFEPNVPALRRELGLLP